MSVIGSSESFVEWGKSLDPNHIDPEVSVRCRRWNLYRDIARWCLNNRMEFKAFGSTLVFRYPEDALAVRLKWL